MPGALVQELQELSKDLLRLRAWNDAKVAELQRKYGSPPRPNQTSASAGQVVGTPTVAGEGRPMRLHPYLETAVAVDSRVRLGAGRALPTASAAAGAPTKLPRQNQTASFSEPSPGSSKPQLRVAAGTALLCLVLLLSCTVELLELRVISSVPLAAGGAETVVEKGLVATEAEGTGRGGVHSAGQAAAEHERIVVEEAAVTQAEATGREDSEVQAMVLTLAPESERKEEVAAAKETGDGGQVTVLSRSGFLAVDDVSEATGATLLSHICAYMQTMLSHMHTYIHTAISLGGASTLTLIAVWGASAHARHARGKYPGLWSGRRAPPGALFEERETLVLVVGAAFVSLLLLIHCAARLLRGDERGGGGGRGGGVQWEGRVGGGGFVDFADLLESVPLPLCNTVAGAIFGVLRGAALLYVGVGMWRGHGEVVMPFAVFSFCAMVLGSGCLLA